MMNYELKRVLQFLDDLMRNNNREWFGAHRAEYEFAQEKFHQFTQDLIVEIGKFDKTVCELSVKDCTYRIYKDMRYSHDGLPYKTHMGAYICPHGKKSGLAGYYFHLEPDESEYLGGNMLSAGIYCPPSKLVKHIRHAILNHGQQFDATVKAAGHFSLKDNAKLLRSPFIYPKDFPYMEYLKLKTYILSMRPPQEMLWDKHVVRKVAELFRETVSYNRFLNEISEEYFLNMDD